MAELSMKQQGLQDSPADNNEDPKLELPGTGQSLEDSSPSRTSEDFNFLVVNPVRRADGLMLCWNKDLNVQITSFSKQHVNFSVIKDTSREWRGSGIYGWPTNQDKYHTWMLLCSIKSLSMLPWVCFVDFNEVLYSFEKVGACGCNMRELEAFAASCQDFTSDHSPILLDQEVCLAGGGKKRGFQFEHMWLRDSRLRGVIEDAWMSGVREGLRSDPAALVHSCMEKLIEWTVKTFGHVQRIIRAKVKRLEKLQKQPRYDSHREQQDLQNKIKELYADEEIMWRQRSRIQWLKEGVKNTHFFHARATSRRKRNNLLKLRTEDERWVNDTNGLCNMMSSYFDDLFQSTCPKQCAEVVSCLDRYLCDTDINMLGNPITECEVYDAVLQMHPSKAHGPDGMTALFYQKFWNIVGPSTVNVMTEFFRTGIMPPNINKTLITLIPKVPSPKSLKYLRPISLCNVIYKIISKVIANRLKGALPTLIDETKSAFVRGRMIIDNAIVAFEVFHWLCENRRGG
ncbi:reverse transcriptase [Tanacetum coccineum]|uniref:Reverse transcriptase n=1 Tax=Tanacetum coccineum TaxID=301880 RepID=A0ABQ5CTE1_9ASTR